MDRFFIATLMNIVLLLMISLWAYYRFRQKFLEIADASTLEDLTQTYLPQEAAYQQLLERQSQAARDDVLSYQEELNFLQSLIKMWSHQMKVPLSALSLMSQTNMLSKEEINQQIIRLDNYLTTLLSFVKFKEKQDDFRFEAIAVKCLVMEQVKRYRILCLAKNLQVEVSGEWQLVTDQKWLSFAISQILDNAIKYSRTGGTVSITMTGQGIIIEDTGIGILEEDLPRLFEEGFTGFNGHQHKKASGLGLYMTKEVLDKLGLKIDIESHIEQGTKVTVRQQRVSKS
ncbi:sensor histidine kinase [Streptococcus dentiloxodontae]